MARTVRVTSAQVNAAKTLVERARQRGQDVSPAVLKIANAQRRPAAEPKETIDAVSFSLLPDELQSVVDTLSEREADVVELRVALTDGEPRTLDEIGKIYGVSRERIRQIESLTMPKPRHPQHPPRTSVVHDDLD